MKIRLTGIILALTAFGCSNKQIMKDEKLAVVEIENKTEKIFKYISDFPKIRDTIQFISALQQTFAIKTDLNIEPKDGIISKFEKIKLFEADREFYLIEYIWGIEGCMASFPWRNQIILTAEGKLIKILSGQRVDFLTIFPNQNPFLMIVEATAKGNGGHRIYKISADTLHNVYEGYLDYEVQTYDAHQDFYVFEPNELKIRLEDENKDGFNDIVFFGQKLMLGRYTKDSLWYDFENGKSFSVENPADRVSIKYIFLYDKETEHFKAKEKYGNDK